MIFIIHRAFNNTSRHFAQQCKTHHQGYKLPQKKITTREEDTREGEEDTREEEEDTREEDTREEEEEEDMREEEMDNKTEKKKRKR